ncbi:MAG: carboxylating nicotinate-nucleotide diphosphorylase, partial [Oscillospiraceae bacterium]
MILNKFYIDDIIKTAILEDINYIDTATDFCFNDNDCSTGKYIAKAEGVLAGIEVAKRVFQLLDDTIEFNILINDGQRVKKGDVIATMEGKTSTLLKGERTSLNILQHMSGIATQTAKCTDLIKDTSCVVCETRKTLPGLRPLQKYAVICGGGKNHRYNLSDACMLKDNHIDAFGGIIPAVEAFRKKAGHMLKIEVEVRNFDELKQALQAKADVIMLDNMSCEDMKKAVEITNKKAVLEASGNITLENISLVAKTGVDIISLGA